MTSSSHQQNAHRGPYFRLAAALLISYVVMFIAMFARVNALGNVYLSLNQFYMAGLMVAPMLVIMVSLMGMMLRNKSLNVLLIGLGVLLTVLFWFLTRSQVGVKDQQFLHSMIPHHASAILVCENASLSDPRVQDLCKRIIDSQEKEIQEMKGLIGGENATAPAP